MKTLYIDSVSGISGNMMIGALLDMGADKEILINGLKSLNIDGYDLVFDRKDKNGIDSYYFNTKLKSEDNNVHQDSHDKEHDHSHDEYEHHHNHHEHHEHHGHHHDHHEHQHEHNHGHHEHHGDHIHRNLFDIEKIIDESDLSEKIKDKAKAIFLHIAKAESKIHGKSLEEVHFHEVGAVDSIVDIVGVSILLDSMDIDKVICSPLHIGRGFVNCAHGKFPVPAPATLEILKDAEIPVYHTGINSELVTPTGAAIVAEIVDSFDFMKNYIIEDIGYGAGTKDLEIPNVLRLMTVKKKS